MARLIVLGNCANQTGLYEATNFILETGQFRVLIDAGPGVVRQLYRADISAVDIDLSVITHCHGDHTLGFPYFLFTSFVERIQGKAGPSLMPIIALPEVYDGIMGMLKFVYPPGEFPNFKVENWRASGSASQLFEFANAKITTTPVSHAVPTIGISFEFASKRIVYSCDTVFDERIVALARGCDVLVHEAFATSELGEMSAKTKHAIAAEAGKVASEAGAQRLVLCHVLPSHMERKKLIIDEASQYYDGEIIVPSELDVIEI